MRASNFSAAGLEAPISGGICGRLLRCWDWFKAHPGFCMLLLLVLLGASLAWLNGIMITAYWQHRPHVEVLFYRQFANYIVVMLIGIATGATELMSRFKDRPFLALASPPGLFYMALNGAAAALAYYLMVAWGIASKDEIQRVMIAGVAAMALFRSGLFTTRVSGKDISFGPNLILQVVLDSLDRAYDRTRANERARLIMQIMSGVDFNQARVNLTEVCFSLMQNVRKEEQDSFTEEVERISVMTNLSDEAKSMALGLHLMSIVGEGTLEAAGRNLGASMFSFTALSAETTKLLAQPSQSDIIANLLTVCNLVSHTRAQRPADELTKIKEQIQSLGSLGETSKATLIAYEARRIFGEKILAKALEMLPQGQITPPPAPPSPKP